MQPHLYTDVMSNETFPGTNIPIPHGLSKAERDEQISNWHQAYEWGARLANYVPTCEEHGCELEGDPDGNYCPECADEADEAQS